MAVLTPLRRKSTYSSARSVRATTDVVATPSARWSSTRSVANLAYMRLNSRVSYHCRATPRDVWASESTTNTVTPPHEPFSSPSTARPMANGYSSSNVLSTTAAPYDTASAPRCGRTCAATNPTTRTSFRPSITPTASVSPRPPRRVACRMMHVAPAVRDCLRQHASCWEPVARPPQFGGSTRCRRCICDIDHSHARDGVGTPLSDPPGHAARGRRRGPRARRAERARRPCHWAARRGQPARGPVRLHGRHVHRRPGHQLVVHGHPGDRVRWR